MELRHQRTGDIFFDLIAHEDSQSKSVLIQRVELSGLGYEYIYQMIETLLPKALYKENEKLKMMEIFADKETKGRKGWI